MSEVTSLTAGGSQGTNVRVYIGGEGPIKDMKDCSLITANYELGDGMKGVIGVIGPKRMDYEKVVQKLQNLRSQLGAALTDENENKGKRKSSKKTKDIRKTEEEG